MMLDEFSWFVGLYDGEGTYYYDNGKGVLEIGMTDEDTIAKVAKFLGCSYREKKVKGNRKPLYRCRMCGGLSRGKVLKLMQDMMPHLSERRQGQIKAVWARA